MTKKDFKLLAELIGTIPTSLCMDDERDFEALIRHFEHGLKTTNPRFNCMKFWAAAQIARGD